MTAPDSGPLATDASLHLLADHLADALDADELTPSLLHVAGVDGGGFDMGTLPLDGQHPTDLLLGFTAPADWYALGLATGGWAYPVDQRNRPDRTRIRVQVVSLLTRSGELIHRTRSGDPALARSLSEELPAGEQVDLLRLALGLATDPAPCDAGVYWTILWLSALTSSDTAPPTCLAEAVRQHPAFQMLDAAEEHLDDDVTDVLAGFHRVCTWRRLQQLAAEGAWPVPDVRPALVHWFDEGAFARFLLNRCRPLGAVRAELSETLDAALVSSIDVVLDALGIPLTAWPDHAAPGTAA